MNVPALPKMIYGTAWKEDATADLVKLAVAAGFRAIDTANQKKHYREDYTGQALLDLYQSPNSKISRGDLFLQSKYTYQRGQDHRLPYNPQSDFSTQVIDSFENTLINLRTDYLDSYLLHGPSSAYEFATADWEVWNTMEDLFRSGKTKMIGVSNINIQQLRALHGKAKIKPQMVQNRCFAAQGWDQNVREFCLENKITYQGFSLLTANQHVLFDPRVEEIASSFGATPAQIMFRFSVQIGILPLTGTTREVHMSQDLKSFDFRLSAEDIEKIYSI